jgi:pimeloyl-ACP methyl ester carboxylesterase
MTSISEGPAAGLARETVSANGLDFAYVAAGDEDAPLALCLHGFPDSALTWRHLLPRLADAGYRAVAPWLRGYAPSAVPEVPEYQPAVIGTDAVALHAVLGDPTAGPGVLIGHDWGAMAAYTAVRHPTANWRRLVALAVPPTPAVAQGFFTYDQLRRSWYMFFFQHPLAELAVANDDLEFIDRLWADWSPGYDAASDLPAVKDALRAPQNLAAALGYYRATLGGVGLSGDPEVAEMQGAADTTGPPLPTLYLHGAEDGCMGADLVPAAEPFLPDDGLSGTRIVPGTGHFLHLERPDEVNALILDFVGPA